MTDSGDFVGTLRLALDQSRFYAARGERPPARLVQGAPGHIWEVVSGLCDRARAEYHGMDGPQYLVRAKVQDTIVVRGSNVRGALVHRGVRTRQVSTHAGFQVDEDSAPMLQWRRGGEARLVERLPTKVCIIDRRFALLPADLQVLAHGMLVLADPVVVKILLAAHQALWRAGADPRAGDEGPPPRLRPVLAMLASGLPDENAARRAGLSPRTYSRRVTELIQLLGATSRFEAGVEAARRGWL